jgi:hypothetical protein
VKTCQINITNEEQKVEAAQKQFDQAEGKYNQFMATQPLQTNAVYVKIKKDLARLTGLIAYQQQVIESQEEAVERTSQPGTPTWITPPRGNSYWKQPNEGARIALNQANQGNLINAENELADMYAQINADQQALRKIENDVDEFQANKLHDAESLLKAAKSRLTEAQSRLTAVESNLDTISHRPLTTDAYFADFTPTAVKKANTDADGNFSLTYPYNKRFTIFAKAERAILSEHKKYFWLIDAPAKTEAGRLLLNNNNLVDVDPDGYFKLKPKETSRDSAAP